MAASEVCCCIACGRDTTSKSGICMRCTNGKGTSRSEHYGRSARYMKDVDDVEPDDETSETRYHGDNWEDS